MRGSPTVIKQKGYTDRSPDGDAKHPWALGRNAQEVWAEIWDVIGPMLDSIMATGEATWSDDLLLILQRQGYPEECYFSFAFSPVRVEGGGSGKRLFCWTGTSVSINAVSSCLLFS